ncbi:MAG: hypothetical protein CSB47_10360 [Proteobacteria bacterium]|nr:MAG: hypothetical protein CSB47_10360 [Pseudomonadota bacterium]
MVAHFYKFYILYSMIIIVWLVQNFLPPAFQGASSETGQAFYGWLTQIDAVLDGLNFIREIGERMGG